MQIVSLGSFGRHTNIDVKSDPGDTFTATRPFSAYLVSATRAIHISNSGEVSQDNFKLPANTYARVTLNKGDVLSFIVAEGEPDGVVSITETA